MTAILSRHFFGVLVAFISIGCSGAYEAKERDEVRSKLRHLGQYISDTSANSNENDLVAITRKGAEFLGYSEAVKEATADPVGAGCFLVLKDKTEDLGPACPAIYYIVGITDDDLLDVLILNRDESVWYRRVSETELRNNLVFSNDCQAAESWVKKLVLHSDEAGNSN